MSIKPLAGRTALVTGATTGIGRAIAGRLAAEGASVVLGGLETPQDGARIAQTLAEETGAEVRFDGTDLGDAAAIGAMVYRLQSQGRMPDILVNNAVVRHVAPVEDFAPAAWEQALAVNLSAAFHLTRLTVAAMKARGWGRIVNMSSVYGHRGAADRVGYVTTKTALLGLTRAVAVEVAGTGVTCNAICPGSAVTDPILEKIAADAQARGIDVATATADYARARQPSGRLVAPPGVAALVAFLCSPAGEDITGADLPIDGGWLAA